MNTGLTLGKFAPLHKGHQFLIETALSEMDRVTILIYDSPDVTNIALSTRAAWIRKLYPEAEVIECRNCPTLVGGTPEIKKLNEDYILKVIGNRKFTHFYSSEFYGEHVSKALHAINRVVDETRVEYPISGTELRKNCYSNRHHIDALVYRDLIVNAVFLGAPSTGKTSIAHTMAAWYDTQWMPEYGREYWENNAVDRRLSIKQLVEIAEEHIRREDILLYEANSFLFTDTNAITTYMFSLYYHGKADKKLIELAKLAEKRYDVVFLCDTDIPYDDTWDRSGDANRIEFQKNIINDLERRNVPYTVLRGNLDERRNTVCSLVEKLRKY